MMVGAILQARMGSTRLPGKIFKMIGHRTLLEHIFYRLSFLEHSITVVLATSLNPKDDAVEVFCEKRGILCYRGNEQDVLSRYYECAQKFHFEHIIRLTGDNPFVDITELDNLITLHLENRPDYSHSLDSLPIGTGSEIFTFQALERSYQNGHMEHHREHVNEYILGNPDLFQICLLKAPKEKNRPEIRLTVDTQEDYDKACYIVENCGSEFITTEEALRLCLQFA